MLPRRLDPYRMREVGETPDYRFSLANERTFLAWIRTALALVGGGLAVAQFVPEFVPELHVRYAREIIAVALMLLGTACAARAMLHWARCELAMREKRDLPPSRFPYFLAATIAAGAVLLILVTLLGGHR